MSRFFKTFSLLPFHAGSPVSLFFLRPFSFLPIFWGHFSLLPKPFLSPHYYQRSEASNAGFVFMEYLLRASRPQWTKIFGLILMKTKIFFGDMSPQTVETWSPFNLLCFHSDSLSEFYRMLFFKSVLAGTSFEDFIKPSTSIRRYIQHPA